MKKQTLSKKKIIKSIKEIRNNYLPSKLQESLIKSNSVKSEGTFSFQDNLSPLLQKKDTSLISNFSKVDLEKEKEEKDFEFQAPTPILNKTPSLINTIAPADKEKRSSSHSKKSKDRQVEKIFNKINNQIEVDHQETIKIDKFERSHNSKTLQELIKEIDKKPAEKKSKQEIKEQRKESLITNNTQKTNTESFLNKKRERSKLLKPKVVVKENGEIVIEQPNLIEINNNLSYDQGFVAVEQKKEKLTSMSFRNKPDTKKWSDKDTYLFYKCVECFGTDFSLHELVFKDRNRGQIKNKYLKEERTNMKALQQSLVKFNKEKLKKIVPLLIEEQKKERNLTFDQKKSKSKSLIRDVSSISSKDCQTINDDINSYNEENKRKMIEILLDNIPLCIEEKDKYNFPPVKKIKKVKKEVKFEIDTEEKNEYIGLKKSYNKDEHEIAHLQEQSGFQTQSQPIISRRNSRQSDSKINTLNINPYFTRRKSSIGLKEDSILEAFKNNFLK